MNVLKIAAFSHNNAGGNPAGVVITNEMPPKDVMLAIAKQVGYSETAFLEQRVDGWRIRYFAPDIEVPFCGHATIASGAALAERFGEGVYKLFLNDDEISVSITKSQTGTFFVTLQSPETWSKDAPAAYVEKIIAGFNFSLDDLDPAYPVRIAFAGAKHLVLVLKDRQKLAAMSYEYELLKTLMAEEGLITINLLFIESNQTIHSRNPFPPGGVYEDPATGAAAAALAGYLRDISWPGAQEFEILQGYDMGVPSRLLIQFSNNIGESIKVSGETRHIIESGE